MRYTLFHEIDDNPETNARLAEIVKSLETNGWQGMPLLADGDALLNGCHRATACEIIGIEPEVHEIEISCTWGDDEYTDMLLNDFADACDTGALLRALRGLYAEGLVDKLSADIMQAEYDKE